MMLILALALLGLLLVGASTLAAAKLSGSGSHGSCHSAKPRLHGTGTRQPSRPRRAPCVRKKIGSSKSLA